MNMDYITGNSSLLIDKFQNLGHDPDSLYYITKDYFNLCSQIGLNSRQTAEIFVKLKNIHDIAEGKIKCEVAIYENNRTAPTRLCVENKMNKQVIFFRIVIGQSACEKKNILYVCENCESETPIKRTEVRTHFYEKHA